MSLRPNMPRRGTPPVLGKTTEQAVADDLRHLVVTHGLRYAKALTDTHAITIEEPAWWEEDQELRVEVREVSI